MGKWNKAVLVLLFGSIWGVLELFGWDLLRAFKVPNKAGILYSFAFIVLIIAKLCLRFPGSLLLVGIITVAYKALGVQFFLCQSAAVMLDAAFIDLAYHVFKEERLKSWKWRSLMAPVTTFLAFLAFGIFREYGYAAVGYVKIGFEGVMNYLIRSGIFAIAVSVFTVHPSYNLGLLLRDRLIEMKSIKTLKLAYSIGLTAIAIMWIASYLHK